MNLCLRRSIVYDDETIIVFYLIFILQYIYVVIIYWFITIVITCYLNILDENIWVVGLSELIIAIKFLKFSKWIEFSQDGNITK